MKLIKPIAAVFLLMLAANVSAQTEKETAQKKEAEKKGTLTPEEEKKASSSVLNSRAIEATKLEAAPKKHIILEEQQEVKKADE